MKNQLKFIRSFGFIPEDPAINRQASFAGIDPEEFDYPEILITLTRFTPELLGLMQVGENSNFLEITFDHSGTYHKVFSYLDQGIITGGEYACELPNISDKVRRMAFKKYKQLYKEYKSLGIEALPDENVEGPPFAVQMLVNDVYTLYGYYMVDLDDLCITHEGLPYDLAVSTGSLFSICLRQLKEFFETWELKIVWYSQKMKPVLRARIVPIGGFTSVMISPQALPVH